MSSKRQCQEHERTRQNYVPVNYAFAGLSEGVIKRNRGQRLSESASNHYIMHEMSATNATLLILIKTSENTVSEFCIRRETCETKTVFKFFLIVILCDHDQSLIIQETCATETALLSVNVIF